MGVGGLKVISTGNTEIDKKLGGGIPIGSMTLIEGESDSGKSVLTQQMVWGSLYDGFRVIVYTTENTLKSFIRQMASLSLEISDFLLLGQAQGVRHHRVVVETDARRGVLVPPRAPGRAHRGGGGGRGLADNVHNPHLH